MIEKLKEGDGDYEVHHKINEIIDHLPQEKCHHLWGYTNTEGQFCGKCGELIATHEPTKEVPDIRPILERLVERIYIGVAMHIPPVIVRKDIDQAIQEISALYKRGINE